MVFILIDDFGYECVTANGGESWEIISPDLSRERPEVPANIGDFREPQLATMDRLGVIYALAPSPRNPRSARSRPTSGSKPIYPTKHGRPT